MKKPPKHIFGYSTWIEMFDKFTEENPDLYDNPSQLLKVKLQFQYMTAPNAPVKRYKITMRQLIINCWLEIMDDRLCRDETEVCVHELARNINYDDRIRKRAIDFLYKMKLNWEI
jgi:hypothetical protein